MDRPGDGDGSSAFGGYSSPSDFLKELRKNLVSTIQASEKIPTGEMNYLICSTFDDFVSKTSAGSTQIASMMKKLSDYWELPSATSKLFAVPSNRVAVLQGVKNSTKQLKERIDLTLDELARLRDEQATSKVVAGLPAQNPNVASPIVRTTGRTAGLMRPQNAYKWKIDNTSAPFKPRLLTKPNALRSLERSLADPHDDGSAPHPYQFELDLFEPSSELMKYVEPIPSNLFEDTAFSYIDEPGELKRALAELRSATEIAVDVEHHSYRTYLGFTCLIQISTREKDYIFDTIKLRDQLHELNEVFTKPDVLKVFHGANLDIQWLQRDLGIYVVNMFDTGQAARALNFSKYSLAFLYQKYLGRTMDKTHQTSDWRLRPLPEEMLTYARMDTHDLLYLYDCIRNDLVKKDGSLQLVKTVYEQSRLLCLQRYEKKSLDENDFGYILTKFAKTFTEQQKFGLKAILEWRDNVARELDESIGYVLPTKMCVDIAEELPVTSDDLIKSVEYVPSILKQKLHHVLELMKQARVFAGIVPLPVSEVSRSIDETTEVVQRTIKKPVTSQDFVKKHGAGFVCKHRISLIYDRKLNMPEQEFSTDIPSLKDIWAHFLTIKEKVVERVTEESAEITAKKPNVHVSVPKELPLEPEFRQPKKKAAKTDTRVNNDTPEVEVIEVDTIVKAPTAVKQLSDPKTTGSTSTKTELPKNLSRVSSSAAAPLSVPPTKRPAFDYATADYSKFSGATGSGANNSGKRQRGGKSGQPQGGVKDPSNSFNKQRNMSATFIDKSGGNKRFRKPE